MIKKAHYCRPPPGVHRFVISCIFLSVYLPTIDTTRRIVFISFLRHHCLRSFLGVFLCAGWFVIFRVRRVHYLVAKSHGVSMYRMKFVTPELSSLQGETSP